MDEQRHEHALPNGFQFEGYRIEGILGAGSFGVTYMAREITVDRAVAIKEYMPSGIATRDTNDSSVRPLSTADFEEFEWGLDRFQKEAAVLVSFRHPNIVPVFRFFEANSTAYMVMEYQEGQSLAQLLYSGKQFDEREIYDIMDPLIEGLERVHAAEFLHRDIKPGNIYIRDDGSPVLIDFGAARQAMGQRSQNLTRIYTPGYAPHEQYETGSQQGPWTDIYALGAVLYVMVADEPPVDAPTRLSAQARKQPDPLKPAAEAARPGFSDQLLTTIDRSLSILEQDRPQSIAEFRGLLLGREGEEVPSTWIRETFVEDEVATAAVSEMPTSPPAAQTAEKRRMRMMLFAALGVMALAGAGLAAYIATDGFGGPSQEEIARRNIAKAAKRRAEAKRKAAERGAQTEARRKEEEAKRKAEGKAKKNSGAEARRKAEARKKEEARRKAAAKAKKNSRAEARRKAEASKKNEAKRRRTAAAAKKAEKEAKRKAAAKKKTSSEGVGRAETRRRAEEERRRREAAARARAEARKTAEIERRRRVEAQRKRAEDARKRSAEERKRQEASAVSSRILARFAGRSIGFRRKSRDYAITFYKGGSVKGTYGEEYGGDTSNTQYFNDTGGWSVRDERLCVKWRSWDRARTVCYEVLGNSLSGGGVMSGRFSYR